MINPIVNGWYADPESRVYNDKVYIYVTKSLDFMEQQNIDLVVTEDLQNYKMVYDILDMSTFDGVIGYVWAPTVVEHKGKYYLIFAANDLREDYAPGGLYIGVSDTPEGKFKNVFEDGRALVNVFHNGAQPIDAHLFKDDNGDVYLYYGGWSHMNVCKLNDDMNGFVELGVPCSDGKFLELTPDKYVEAPYVAKIDGKYQLMYSSGDWMNGTYCVKAAEAKTPISEFKFYADVLEKAEIADGPGHNSAFTFKGKDYVAYHRRIVGDTNPHHRVLCIDQLRIENGRFTPVTMT